MDENRAVDYHSGCGHTTLDPYAAGAASNVPSELHTCSHKPDHYVESCLNTCKSCSSGDSQPLVGVSLEQKTAEIRLLQDGEQKFLKEISERNEPLEESVCNMAPETLGLPHARQIHTLYYQLDHVLLSYKYQVKQYYERKDRLEEAMLGFSRSLLKELTVEERVYNIEILVKRFGSAVFDFDHRFFNPYLIPPDDKEPQIATIDGLQDEIEDQIQLQFELMGHISRDPSKLKERWSDTREAFRYKKWQWSQIRAGRAMISIDDMDYSNSNSEDEASDGDSGLGLWPGDEP